MPYRQSLKRFSSSTWESFVQEFRETHDERLMEAVVAGCAIVAYADGWVKPEERRRMLGLIRGFGPIDAFGPEEVEHYFDEVTGWFTDDHDAGENRALEVVTKLRGRGRNPELLVEACCAIAASDGGFDAEERQAARRICETLDLDPAKFDLADAR